MDLIVKKIGDELWEARHGDRSWRCAVGRGGIHLEKREGDGVSPVGCWPIRQVYYRADRMEKPVTALPCTPIDRLDGWCDEPSDPNYNRKVRLPYAASHEEMWREDALYDIVVVLGHNDDPVVPGAGSAIFLHLARETYSPTAGCAALSREDLLEFLARAEPSVRLCFSDAD